MAAPLERRIEASDRYDANSAYITRGEARPLIETRRQRIARLTYSTDGTRFPGEPKLNILPFVGTRGSKKDLLSHMSPKRTKKHKLFDLWKV